jgi:mono/diheme cytochrome c family protein
VTHKPLFSLVLASAVLMTGCQRKIGPPEDSQEHLRPEEIASFDHLYTRNCSACHGENGRNGPALDLANPMYQSLADDASLKHWIVNGMPGTEMPAFGESAGGFLTDRQIDALVKGMRTHWLRVDSAHQPQTPSYATVLQGNIADGERIYQAACLSCHRDQKQQITNPTYLALISDQALRSIVIAGRPDLGHPGWDKANSGHALSDQEITDIVAYMGSLRSATPGQPYPEQMNRER